MNLNDSQDIASLTEICLKVASRQLNAILTEIRTSRTDSYIAREKQLTKVIQLFIKNPQHYSGLSSLSSAVPAVPPHLVKNLIGHIGPTERGPVHFDTERMPFLLYLAVCRIYSHIDTFGFKPDGRLSITDIQLYYPLNLDEPIELELLHKYLHPSQFITILNLSGHKHFLDSSLIKLHHVIGHSVRSIILDDTSVTDHGIAHLSRPLSFDATELSNQTGNRNYSQRPFQELISLSLSGLTGITDRSAKNLSKFPNLLSIDLSGTSCTDAARRILNRSQNNKQCLFRYAASNQENACFDADSQPLDKLFELMKYQHENTTSVLDNEHNTTTTTNIFNVFFFEIEQTHRLNVQRSSSEGKIFQACRLIRNSSSSGHSSSAVTSPKNSLPSNSTSAGENSSSLPSIKRKRKPIIASILDDLPQFKKTSKK
ncbi:hypothetical protein PCANC_15353 [Puccinia coronata f. sp. avenae]|uniref:Uncharacterized protein n=1 Tax=Puccinia coronata f. sp. avenae TaxID=200324 RepID=A0A2N5UFB7_9BASI|nr:hypothetical protein PCANC_15353 [Puccinia coronata f. sp. avenae]PLW36445.1 hypothetical protein PCASD_11185 [Puccinia coronata f. sp. avenae]